MALNLFAGAPVTDSAAALACYEQVPGAPPSFFPHDTEAVWQLAEHRDVYLVQRPGQSGNAMHTVLVDDLDTRVAQIADRGLRPTKRESYPGDLRKVIYHDPDGNEFGFGGTSP